MAVGVALPFAAAAQSSDAAYCKALTDKYQTYVTSMDQRRGASPGPVDGAVAIEKCQAGDTASGIPVLEQKLRDAKIDPPKR